MNTAVSIDLDNLDDVPAKTLLRLVERNQQVKKYLASFQLTVNHFTEFFRVLEAWDIDVGFDVSNGLIDLSFSGDGDRFGAMWAELRRQGYKPSSRPKKGDVSFYGSFEQEGYARIWMNFTSTVCERVQVGTKTVEQPIYETRCGAALEQITADHEPPLIEPVPSAPPAEG